MADEATSPAAAHSVTCPHCIAEHASQIIAHSSTLSPMQSPRSARRLTDDMPMMEEEEELGKLHVTPYKKALTKKRTYSYGASVNTPANMRIPSERSDLRLLTRRRCVCIPLVVPCLCSSPRLQPSTSIAPPPSSLASSSVHLLAPKPYSPRTLQFDELAGAGQHAEPKTSEKGGVDQPAGGAEASTSYALHARRSNDDSSLGSKSTGDAASGSDSEDVVEETEDDSEQDIEHELHKDVARWYTPLGWWQQICLLLSLAAQLISVLGWSFKWVRMLWRLILFSIALAPAWVLIGHTYFTAPYVKRAIRYGVNARNYLDMYLPHRIVSKARANSSATTSDGTCERHREALAAATRKRSVDSLNLVERLHLNALLNDGIELNAMAELNDQAAESGQGQPGGGVGQEPVFQGSRTEVFAAQVTGGQVNEQQQQQQSGSNTTAAATSSPIPPTFTHLTASPVPASSASAAGVHLPPSFQPHPASPPQPLAPVVIFITGGAWSIGYKAWGALLGLGLSAHGILVASVDYRNFPQGSVSDMSRDVSQSIVWVFRHAGEYGGDVRRVYIVGQSAGAHLGALAILQNVASLLRGERTLWSARHVAGFVGISGCYNLPRSKMHFHERGLPLWVFMRMMQSLTDDDLASHSPVCLVKQDLFRVQHSRAFTKLMPAILLVHGKGDKTVHWTASDEFATVLHQAGVRVKVRYYKSQSITLSLSVHES